MSVRCQTYALHLTLTASWPPTRSGELFNCKHPDYRPVYAERAVRLARIRTPSGSCQPCAPNCLKLPFTTGSSGHIAEVQANPSAGGQGRTFTFAPEIPALAPAHRRRALAAQHAHGTGGTLCASCTCPIGVTSRGDDR